MDKRMRASATVAAWSYYSVYIRELFPITRLRAARMARSEL